MKKIESQPWWPKLVAKKDDMSLRQLSDEFGVSPAAISNALKRNKLNRKSAPSGPRVKTKVQAKVGKRPRKSPKTAKRVKTEKATKSRRAKTPIAADAIPKQRARRTRKSSLSQYQAEMGTVVDRIIAEKAGVTVSAVTNYRRRHKIAAVAGRGRPRQTPTAASSTLKQVRQRPVMSKPVVAKRPVTQSRSAQSAFRVNIGTKKVIVVASDIAEAAALALASGKGQVTRIRLIGPALTR